MLDGPDPAQMEDAPDLGYRPVPHGLQIPDNLEMGAPSSVGWTSMNRILVFNRGPNPLMEFEPDGTFVRSWGQGQYDRARTACASTRRATSGPPTSTPTRCAR